MLGVIPAAGKAHRFGGLHKELLPVSEGLCLLADALYRARGMGCHEFCIITRPDKAQLHAQVLEKYPEFDGYWRLLVQTDSDDLWGAIRTSLYFGRDSLLVLPDTLWSVSQPLDLRGDLCFGVFETQDTGRYSILAPDGRIATKWRTLPWEPPYQAWGYVYWTSFVSDYWLRQEEERGTYAHYDQAFEDATRVFSWCKAPIDSYHDLGTWESYRNSFSTGRCR